MRNALLAAALLAASYAHGAAFDSAAIGTTGGQFLELAPGARAAAMGGAYVAAAEDATALYWNPAALSRINGSSLALMHSSYLASTFFDYASYGENLGNGGAFGLSVQYFSAQSITETQDYVPVGTFTPYDLAATVGYALTLNDDFPALAQYSLGVSGKFISSHILKTANTGAGDFGILSPAYFEDSFRWGVSGSNIGGTLKYEQTAENLPMSYRLGATFRPVEPWLLSADAVFPRDGQPYAALGTEYRFVSLKGNTLSGRMGYNSQNVSSGLGFTGPSFGIGLGFQVLSVDYAFVPFGGLGQEHMLSLSFNFGAQQQRREKSSRLEPVRRESTRYDPWKW